ncbi:chaperonin 10-like protein [Mycena albidolilacea]|uniref:Chaperonin 10-like protein n=1 Tax=Mycena albidolilacea TaxID=1033008 RepID=A0AAD7AM25_9AGAR|nr:chaperonin 10-like protein [Mycena albidolilacea]
MDAPTVVSAEYKPRADGSTMKALSWFGARDVCLVDAPPDDVILKVTGTTICESDLHLYHGEIIQQQEGDILGHEFMGVVDRVGSNVSNIHVGQRVVTSFQIACGECSYCKQKLSSTCDRTNSSGLQNAMYGHRDAGFFGYSHFTGGFPGGRAEYISVPKGNVNLLPIPDSVSDEKALYLSDIVPTSYHAVVDARVKPGDVGLSPIGQCAARFALMKGASRVIGIDNVPSRLIFAQEKSGIEVINFAEHADVVKRIQELVPGRLDVAIDCGMPTFHQPKTLLRKVEKTLMLETDVSEIVNDMITATRKMGSCGIIAAYAGRGFASSVTGRRPYTKYWHELLALIEEGKFDPTFVLTHRVPLDDFPALYASFDKRVGGVKKVFVETKFSPPPFGAPRLSRVAEYKLESGPNIDDPMQWGADKDLEFLRSHRHPTYYSDLGSQLKVVIPLAD